MDATNSTTYDPLQMNIHRQTELLVSSLPAGSYYANLLQQATTTAHLLTALSKLLKVPSLTQKIATLFRPILLDLGARWLEDDENVEEQLIALCLLLEVHEELYPILLRLLLQSFTDGPLGFLNTESLANVDTPRLQRLLLAYYRILQANRELPMYLNWSLSPLSKLMWTPELDNGVRFLAIRCYSLQSGMGEGERVDIEKEVFGELCGAECDLEYGQSEEGVVKRVDGWILPAIEVRRIQEERDAIVTVAQDYYHECPSGQSISSSDLSPFVTNVCGILLVRSSTLESQPSALIPTPTSRQALRTLAQCVSLRLPTLLTSPPSAGKTLLLEHLASQIHPQLKNHIITIHLADTSLDPRALLGTYISSPAHPGTFEWKEGALVRSMKEGKWVVFEDIDKGSNEVLGVIKPLVESLCAGKWIGGRAQLEVPGRGRIIAHDNFMLFATRSLQPSRHGNFPPPIFFGSHKFHELAIQSPSPSELRLIVDARFPRLAGSAAQAIINVWDSVRSLGTTASAREIGLRELEKFCSRIDRLLPASYQPMDLDTVDDLTLSSVFINPSLREDMYLESRDVFFGAGASTTAARAHTERIASVVASHLGLNTERSEWVLRGKIPEIEMERDVNGRTTAARIGRTRLLACPNKPEVPSRPFALHKPAVVLLSRISSPISLGEPILLTGETGTGKTSVVSYLAALLRKRLISLNLSHQTESSDLIGGLKPLDARVPASALQEKFMELFGATFSRRKNEAFETEVRKAVVESKWKRVVRLWKDSAKLAKSRLEAKRLEIDKPDAIPTLDTDGPRKRRKVDGTPASEAAWDSFIREVDEFEVQHVQGKGKFAFGFVEGPLVKALRSGDWVLLDEANLASPETLECISGLLQSPTASITLTEHGSLEAVPRHPEFRLFACMNPATDVGKKDLPPNMRSRFTEIDVPPPDADRDTLLTIVTQYIGPYAVGDKGAIMNVAEFYAAVKNLAEKRQISDGSNHRPHFSMRTLIRAMTFVADTVSVYGLRRAIWEGCLMAFTMVLDSASAEVVTALAHKHLLAGVKNPRSMLAKEPSSPQSHSPDEFIKFGPFYLEKGPFPVDPVENYIMTPSVERKLIDLSRIILTRRFPVLIEGPTSSGKTSSVEYLAKRTGHRFVRINNHEHTDIQEYIGSYVSDPLTGKLVFKDGLLVRALRNGDWIVLDELNLAPTDVLEALNRLLDDNRELVIPETQEVVRPHPHFMLFATQNPPGLYAGRKVLSRAFRNRFLEVHFEDVPQVELETILCQRCQIAPSYGSRIVTVFRELQKRRQSSRVFESKQGFATLRDLFRWAGRDAVGYQELAENGYMLLAERARREDDKIAVKEIIESVMRVKIDEQAMYELHRPGIDMQSFLGCSLPSDTGIVWTKAMRRLYVLMARALRFQEPVLLVGETGSGKTSVCQVYANACFQHLRSLNCHQNTETADLIGGLRPVRNRSAAEADVFQEAIAVLDSAGIRTDSITSSTLSSALKEAQNDPMLSAEHKERLRNIYHKALHLQSIFDWKDGPLIESMRQGDVFLLDEISLADDSVLERLNSVLEPGRTIVLAEKGGSDAEDHIIKAEDTFKLVATMNPGGDYGKKELSPALRNRFTEIWVPSIDDRDDLELIVKSLWRHPDLTKFTTHLLDFVEWLCKRVGDLSLRGLRDILAWVTFSNEVYNPSTPDNIQPSEIFHHAAHMTYLDGLSSLPQLTAYSKDAINKLKVEALSELQRIVPISNSSLTAGIVHDPSKYFQLGAFAIPRGPHMANSHSFNLSAPTTRDNAMRIIRACQVPKPILLEGSPGVGKTSLITALANIAGHELCRINLSDQTDLMDLFGTDLPVEGGKSGEFAWKDAEFLKALQEGRWVLLDEMNLAPQAVLEGLNAVLDHRGTVYIPELGRSFERHPSFRIFAAQNPLSQGGGRKGLPKSFLNRFTKVYVEELSAQDLFIVCQHLFPQFDEDVLRAMISFNMHLNDMVAVQRLFAREGSPWEFNLRDVVRWGTLLSVPGHCKQPAAYLSSVYSHRFRTGKDRSEACCLFDKEFSLSTVVSIERQPEWWVSDKYIQIGHYHTKRRNNSSLNRPRRILKCQLSALQSIGDCVSQSWLAIVTGYKDSGKTSLIRALANITGNVLQEISVNSASDTMDIIGSFEQVDRRGRIIATMEEISDLVGSLFPSTLGAKLPGSLYEMARSLDEDIEHALVSIPDVLQNAMNFLGHLNSFFPSNQDIAEIQRKLERLISSSGDVARFEWVDGPLVRAMKTGHWLLMDGANLCNPSVLDRLNSLCEPNGVLILSERGFVEGSVEVIKPHPNFRLFMAVDPSYGELSRAMRNRGIEIFITGQSQSDDGNALTDHFRLPRSLATEESYASRCLLFDAARRGLGTITYASRELTSLGRPLDQDSALTNIVDQYPALYNALLLKDVEGSVRFISRILSPLYTPYLLKYLQAFQESKDTSLISSFLSTMKPMSITAKLAFFRESYTSSKKIPLPFVETQPLDFYLTVPSEEFSLKNEEKSSMPPVHMMLLSILNLWVALFLNEIDREEINVADNLVDAKISLTINHTKTVLRTIQSLGQEVVAQSFQEFNQYMADRADALTMYLRFARFLKKTFDSSTPDFSAMQAIMRWILDAAKHSSTLFPELWSQINALRDAVSLSRGLGLIDIWTSLQADHRLDISWPELQQIERLACSISGNQPAISIRRQAFEVMAASTLPSTWIDDHRQGLSELQNVLGQCLRNSMVNTDNQWDTRSDPSMLLVELGALVSYKKTGNQSSVLREIIALAHSDQNTPFIRLLPYQHLLWGLETNQELLPVETLARLQWLESLWDVRNDDLGVDGASLLLHATALKITSSTCDFGKVSLGEIVEYENELRRIIQMTLLQHRQNTPRLEQLRHLLVQSLISITACFPKSFDAVTYNAIISLDSDHPQALGCLVNLVQKSSSIFLRTAAEQYLRNVSLESCSASNMGLVWIAASRFIFELIIPDAPIDPIAIRNRTKERLQTDRESIAVQIELHCKLEELLTGNAGNALTDDLHRELEMLDLSMDNTSIGNRSDLSLLNRFWSEVSQFHSSVASQCKVDELLNSLRSGEEAAALRENVIQQSLAGFCQRLDSVYSAFADLIIPIKLAIMHLRMGLRLSSPILRDSKDVPTSVSEISRAIVRFPAVSSASDMFSNSGKPGPNSITQLHRILLELSAVAMEKAAGIELETLLPFIEAGYEQALRLWLIDRAKEKELDEASNSLYRGGNIDHNAVGDAELEEQEFLTLFPSFEDVFDKQHRDNEGIHCRNLLVQHKEADTLLQIHYALIKRPENFSDIYWGLRKTAVASLLESPLPSELDDASLLFRLSLLNDASVRFQGNPTHPQRSNFYADANVNEVKKATVVVGSLKKRLAVLKQEWPDQMVLDHLLDRCETILSLALHSPVAKVLSALEQLLVQTEDWEMYANKENSLRQYQQSIIGLIVDWRRLELTCWQTLLDTQAESFLESISDWWFRLYDATIRGVLDAADRNGQGGIDQYLGTLVPLLNDFMSSSPLGQFHARMRLLESFHKYLLLIRNTKSEDHRGALDRVGRVLHSTHLYYDQFSSAITNQYTTQKASLEKEIKDFIKLASWKDINVHALKQSAQRTHHQLYKIIRKFRDVLRQSVTQHLVHSLTIESVGHTEPQELIVENDALDIVVDNGVIFEGQSAELERKYDKFTAFINSRIVPFIRSSSSTSLESLVSDVILTVQELSAVSVSSNGSAERCKKHIKALLVRKRKAWSDLLKELKRAGLTSNVRPDVLQKHSDERWIREQPVLDSVEAIGTSACKINRYLCRLMGSLPDLRSALPNHHSDLTTRELKRGISFLESGFSLALELRAHLSTALSQYAVLEKIFVRLRTLRSSSKIFIYQTSLFERVIRIKDILCLLSSALQEAQEAIKILNELEKVKIDESLMQEIRDICSANQEHYSRMVSIYEGLSAVPSIVSQGEEKHLFDVISHIGYVKNLIISWSVKEPRLTSVCAPLETWLSSQHIPSLLHRTSKDNASQDTTSLVNVFLVSVQNLISKCPEVSEQHIDDNDDRYILNGCRSVLDTTYLLNLGTIVGEFQKILPVISSESIFHDTMQRAVPFLSVYLELSRTQLRSHGSWTKSILKMVSVLCTIMQRLAQDGFCQPPEDDTGDADMGATQTMDGTGLGEGTGNENVSKEIEDESQVEGLQDDGTNQNTEKPNNEDDAIEMSEEFAGDLEDVPDDGSDNEDDNSDAESDVSPEERAEKLDPTDPEAVDEKLWGDEKGPDGGNEGDDKTAQDHSEEKGNDSEIVAKEGKEKDKKDKSKSKDKESDEERSIEDEGRDEELPEDQGEGEEETDPNVSGAPMDEHLQDADTLDLPDDMDLGKDELNPGEDSGMEEGAEDDTMDDGGMSEEHEDVHMEDNYEQPPGNGDEEGQESPEERDEEHKEPPVGDNQIAEDEDKSSEQEDNQAVARPDVAAGDGTVDPSDNSEFQGGEESVGQGGQSKNNGAHDTATDDVINDQETSTQPQLEAGADAKPAQSMSKGSADGTEQGQTNSQEDQPSATTNPIRNMGDTLKEIRQRFDEILNSIPNDTPRENMGQSESQGKVEYLQPEDIDSEMQAMGPAGDDQVAKLDQLNLIDDESPADPAANMDIDEAMQTEEHQDIPHEPPRNPDRTTITLGEDVEGALVQNTVPTIDTSITVLEYDPALPKSTEELQEQDHDVETQLRKWRAAEFPDDGAEHMWRLYESMTHDLAYALCEQLRLILEPTMATRLKGDYRTGKRLNMKKIISYIASDYTKDKIWLRRTKPSQREYQVLIAIDDSRSMAESHSVHLAYETLCLISKALTRLESGDVGVVKFGETVDILHGFDEGPFTDQAGVKVMSAFKFKQKATNVLSLVETSLKVLESARERRAMGSASATDLWQLEIIISDGICQDHDKLRAVLRKAEEQRVMIVFIVIDSLHAAAAPSGSVVGERRDMNKNSILHMENAEYKNVDGRMELQLRKYLDSFPFEYYVILRNVEALPEVLSSTLKQFFERISEE